MTDNLPDDYDGYNVEKAIEYIASVTDPNHLNAITAYESQHKDRVTVHDAVEGRKKDIDYVDADDDESAPDEDESDDSVQTDRNERVRVRSLKGGHVAGYSFKPGEVKHVDADAQVKKAIMRGKLQTVA